MKSFPAYLAFFPIISLCLYLSGGRSYAQAADWPDVLDPLRLEILHLELENPADWDVIRFDKTFDIEVPAWFWAEGEEDEKLYVSVRRKSCDAMPDENDPFKISVKIDINEYISGQKWRDLTKLSLENGDDADVLAEGLAGNLHRMAVGPAGYSYPVSYCNWAVLYINGVNRGVYVNIEQVNKQFLRNRGFYERDASWLYKYGGGENFTIEVAPDDNPISPGVREMCYRPFASLNPNSPLHPAGGICPTPEGEAMEQHMSLWMDVRGLLTIAAVDAFVANPDALFSHARNTYFIDFDLDDPEETRRRMYLPWDNDSVLTATDFNIYTRVRGSGPTYFQTAVLGNPVLRSQYNRVMRDLLNGPLSIARIHAFLDAIQPVLADALEADPYSKLGSGGASGRIAEIKNWISSRVANVLAQVDADEPMDYCDWACRCRRANMDGLGLVDIVDLAILAGQWGRSGPGLSADLDEGLYVGFADLRLFAEHWLSDCGE